MSEEHKNCKYRFKGKSCKDCSLNCKVKRLQEENEELKKQQITKNGIDVSEEIRYCNNCSNLGLDFKAGKFYCSLSHRPDELPEVLSCDEFSTNCYIKRLQEENKKSELYEKNVQLQEENEELKKYQYTQECLQSEIEKRQKALEEIRDRLIVVTEEEPQSTQNLVLDLKPIIEGVLNDRD